jgi:hypothetical protein
LALVETIDHASALSIGHYQASVTYEDAGTGASTAVALAGFPLGVLVLGGWLEITEAFAGEADASVTVGDTSDADYLISSFNLNAVAAIAVADTTIGSGALPCTEADWDGDGLDITFSATELGDLTAGALTVHILYHRPE